jgi:hypothetical protein
VSSKQSFNLFICIDLQSLETVCRIWQGNVGWVSCRGGSVKLWCELTSDSQFILDLFFLESFLD